jgi:hypothetical protein
MKKVFLMFFVSACFGFVVLVLWPGSAYAPPNCSSVSQNLGICQDNLTACEEGLAACEAQPPAPVPQTGQNTCWDDGGLGIGCSGTGQDGDIQAGVAWPNPRFTDNLDGTITDNLTHLIWLKNANCFGDRDWVQALEDANTLHDGECDLMDGSEEGDWRLSNRNELESLLDLENHNPALPTGHPFMNFQPSGYWSSTTTAPPPLSPSAWIVEFKFGQVFFDGKTDLDNWFVLPVRGGS